MMEKFRLDQAEEAIKRMESGMVRFRSAIVMD